MTGFVGSAILGAYLFLTRQQMVQNNHGGRQMVV